MRATLARRSVHVVAPRVHVELTGSLRTAQRANKPLSTPLFQDGRFSNPWSTWREESFATAFRVSMARLFDKIPSQDEIDAKLPMSPVSHNLMEHWDGGENEIRLTWFGQSTFLLQTAAFNILTDPVFSERTWVFGHKRMRPVPIPLSELPPIHCVLVSHSHADHLDASVVRHFRDAVHWFVPKGLGQWFGSRGVSRVTELTWWDTAEITMPNTNNSNALDIVCVPAQHHTQRTPFDKNKSLWCGFVVKNTSKRICFVGDTGYCPVFKEIGDTLGPFDLSLIPIGTYEPREHMKPQHCNPEDAVAIHEDLRSKYSVAMHWGTFQYSNEPVFEPPQRLKDAVIENNCEHPFVVVPHGTTMTV